MKIILAPDKFKNSLTGIQFCNIVEAAIKTARPDIDIIKTPLADGGDGTIEVVNYYLQGKDIEIEVNNPFFNPVKATYLYSEILKTAFIEMAEASGVKLLKSEQLDCKNATTYGTGEMIADAIKNGAQKIILGIGGSATNDCGIGMASALGFQFLDKNNKQVKPIGANLSKIKIINSSKVNPKLKSVKFEIACDVKNPLYGPNGAACIYAKQKGATKQDVKDLDQGLQHFSKVLHKHFNIKTQQIPGAGAAGGMGAGAVVFLNGTLLPGIDVITEIANFKTVIKHADWIVTGEGKLDGQTLSGKALSGLLKLAKTNNIKVAAFCGSVDLDAQTCLKMGVNYYDAIINYAINLDDAITNTKDYLEQITNVFMTKTIH